MPEGTENGGTSESLTVDQAASLFERMDSGEPDHSDADESQQDTVEDQPEQVDDEVVADRDADERNDDEQDDEGEEGDAESEPKPRTIRVKLPEGEQELPEDEVAKGYLRQADYTRKTQAHAEEVKAFKTKQAEVSAQAEQYATALSQLAEALKQQTPQEPDWDKLQQENPDEFAATWAAWQRHTQNVARLDAARKEAIEKVTQDQIERYNAHVEAEREKLIEAIPSWKDEKVATKERKALFEFAKSAGYTDAELDNVADHRVMVLLRKAYLYDQAQQRRPAVQAKIESVKAATPGPAGAARKQPMPERTKAKLRLAKTGSIKDAAAYFEQMED